MNLGDMIRSEEYMAWEAAEELDLAFSDPDMYGRLHKAAEDGSDGRTHGEVITMWRDYVKDVLRREGKLSDDELSTIEKQIDACEEWHQSNGSLDQQCG